MDTITPFLNFASTAAVAILAAFLGWSAKKSEWKRDLYFQKATTMQSLYADFLSETNRLALTSADAKSSKAGEFHRMTEYFSRIELLSSEPVIEAARAVCGSIIDSHGAEAENSANYAGLKAAFVMAARKEVGDYQR